MKALFMKVLFCSASCSAEFSLPARHLAEAFVSSALEAARADTFRFSVCFCLASLQHRFKAHFFSLLWRKSARRALLIKRTPILPVMQFRLRYIRRFLCAE